MPQKSIEDFLGLSEETISQRIAELRARIPTRPGTGYLQTRLQEFKVQPWPYVIYLAYNNPDLLRQGLHQYLDYDGAENYQVIFEKLSEYHILGKLLEEMEREKTTIDV